MWLYGYTCGYNVVIMWLYGCTCGYIVWLYMWLYAAAPAIRGPRGSDYVDLVHVGFTWMSRGLHVFNAWLSREYHVVVTLISRGNHVDVTWVSRV
jgi:hypothetical protein